MAVYVLAQLDIVDRARYQRYVDRFLEVLAPYKGRVLAADDAPEVLDGTWDRHRVVIISFSDEATCRAWASSAAYQEIAEDRKAGAEGPLLLVHGLS